MGTIASQITSLNIVYSTVYSGTDQRKHQSSASLAFVWGIQRGPGTGEFLAQMASNAENVFIWWRHHIDTMCIAQADTSNEYCGSRDDLFLVLKETYGRVLYQIAAPL